MISGWTISASLFKCRVEWGGGDANQEPRVGCWPACSASGLQCDGVSPRARCASPAGETAGSWTTVTERSDPSEREGLNDVRTKWHSH